VRRQSDRLGTRSCDVEAQRQRASDGELDRGASRCPRDATRGASTPRLPSYMHAWEALRRGLDNALSVVSARPAGQAVRGFVVELLARASQLAQRRAT
jgi:hypothetical protein